MVFMVPLLRRFEYQPKSELAYKTATYITVDGTNLKQATPSVNEKPIQTLPGKWIVILIQFWYCYQTEFQPTHRNNPKMYQDEFNST